MQKCMKCMGEIGNEEFCPHCGNEVRKKAWVGDQLPEETILNKRYIVGREITRDALGITYMAWDAEEEQRVAIKEWFPAQYARRLKNLEVDFIMDRPKARSLQKSFYDFLQMQISRKLSMLVSIREAFWENGTVYYTMEYLEGTTIRQLLQKENPLSQDQADHILDLMLQTAEQMHTHGVIHGNLNPDNIVLLENDQICFLNRAQISNDAGIMGNELYYTDYTAPAFYDGTAAQGKDADTYSIYAVYYRMITGQSPLSVLERRKGRRLPSPKKLGIAMDPQMEETMMQKLHLPSESAAREGVSVKNSKGGTGLLNMTVAIGVTLCVLVAAFSGIMIYSKFIGGKKTEKGTEEWESSSESLVDAFRESEYGNGLYEDERESAIENTEDTENPETDLEATERIEESNANTQLSLKIDDILGSQREKWKISVTAKGEDVDKVCNDAIVEDVGKSKYLFFAELSYLKWEDNPLDFPNFSPESLKDIIVNMDKNEDISKNRYRETLTWWVARDSDKKELNPGEQLTEFANNNGIQDVKWENVERNSEGEGWRPGTFCATAKSGAELMRRIVEKYEDSEIYGKLRDWLRERKPDRESEEDINIKNILGDNGLDVVDDNVLDFFAKNNMLEYFACVRMSDGDVYQIGILTDKNMDQAKDSNSKGQLKKILEAFCKYCAEIERTQD